MCVSLPVLARVSELLHALGEDVDLAYAVVHELGYHLLTNAALSAGDDADFAGEVGRVVEVETFVVDESRCHGHVELLDVSCRCKMRSVLML